MLEAYKDRPCSESFFCLDVEDRSLVGTAGAPGIPSLLTSYCILHVYSSKYILRMH